MNLALIVFLVLAMLIQGAMLVSALVMLYRNFRQLNAYDVVIFRRVEEILKEIRTGAGA